MSRRETTPTGTASSDREPRSLASLLPVVARVLMGLIFLVTGLNGFLNFLPQPSTPLPQGALAFTLALMNSGYLFQLVSITQAGVGLLLLANRFVPLALTVIAPVVVNIAAFHAFLWQANLPLPIAVVVLEIYLAWVYRKAFRPLLAPRATPD